MPPTHLVRRPRLDRLLDEGLRSGTRLVLLSAPAGSGKSTLLASWLTDRHVPVAWLQVEESDSDPAQFWTSLVGALADARPEVAAAVRPVVAGSYGDDVTVVPPLVNALEATGEPLVVVVDDYHLIESARVHRGMERLIELCPRHVTFVLATRFDPPFRLGRLRVRKQITEVRAEHLRFDAMEASGLLGAAASKLRAAHLDGLCSRTEGWAAGLVLAGLSLTSTEDPVAFVEAFRGDDQLVVDYLRDELLDSLESEDRRRMVETSVLDHLSGNLVDAVTGTHDGGTWLAATAQRNQLLIALDRTGTWFRYHHLLRDLLRLEAQRTIPTLLPGLHGRAGTWFEANGDQRHAMVHHLAAGDAVGAERVLFTYGPQLLRDGQIDTLRRHLEQLGHAAETSVVASLLFGWCEFIGGRYGPAESWLARMVAAAPPGFNPNATAALRINISLARGDVSTGLALASEISATNQLAEYASDLSTAVGAAYTWAGQADPARTTLRLAVEKAEAEGSRSPLVLALVYRAILELDAGTTGTALAAAEEALATATSFGLDAYHGVAPAYAVRARAVIEDNPVTARADAATAIDLARRVSTDIALAHVLTTCGDTLLSLGDKSAAALVAEARSVVDRCADPGIVGRQLARVEARHGVGRSGSPIAPALAEQLTDRELAVLRYLPTQMSQRDIAAELYISLNTVKTHCRAIYRKLGVVDRHAAVQAGRDLCLL